MTQVKQGGTIALIASFVDAPGGVPVDPSAISLQVNLHGVLVSGPFVYPTNVIRDDVGLYRYEYAVSGSAAIDTYTAKWSVTIAGNAVVAYEDFDVIAGPAGTITGVSPTDVLNATGVTVSSNQIAQAQNLIEVYASVSLADFGAFDARNRFWLQKAVIFQTVWMAEQVDVYGRTSFMSQTQDGLTFNTYDRSTMVLAPLAQKALSRVAWLRARVVRLQSMAKNSNGEPFGRVPDGPITDIYWDQMTGIED